MEADLRLRKIFSVLDEALTPSGSAGDTVTLTMSKTDVAILMAVIDRMLDPNFVEVTNKEAALLALNQLPRPCT